MGFGEWSKAGRLLEFALHCSAILRNNEAQKSESQAIQLSFSIEPTKHKACEKSMAENIMEKTIPENQPKLLTNTKNFVPHRNEGRSHHLN